MWTENADLVTYNTLNNQGIGDCAQEESPTEKQNYQTTTWKTEDKENLVEPKNNLFISRDKGCKIGTIARAEKMGFSDEQNQHFKRFDERILKLGKDTTMMCTLLNALRRDGKQQRKDTETSKHNVIHRRRKRYEWQGNFSRES